MNVPNNLYETNLLLGYITSKLVKTNIEFETFNSKPNGNGKSAPQELIYCWQGLQLSDVALNTSTRPITCGVILSLTRGHILKGDVKHLAHWP